MTAIELQQISKRYAIYARPIDRLKELMWRNRRCYHKDYWALRNIDLEIESGATTAIIGPNGSGKSTLLQIIAGVLQPTYGTMRIHGRVTAILELGAGFQTECTGRENVLLNGMLFGVSQPEMLERMDSIAEFAEIGDFFDQPIKTYSSGMVVRLAFASAITVDPEILLVDEALAVGDEKFQKKCFLKILEMQESGKTIVFVSHNMESVEEYCHQAILLNGGELAAKGPTKLIVPQYRELMGESGQIAPKVFSEPASV